MPKVPEYNLKPLKTIYNPVDVRAPVSLKQKNLIITLCERRKIEPPPMKYMKIGEASQIISNMLNTEYSE